MSSSSTRIVRGLFSAKKGQTDQLHLRKVHNEKFDSPKHELDMEKFINEITPRKKVMEKDVKAFIAHEKQAVVQNGTFTKSEKIAKLTAWEHWESQLTKENFDQQTKDTFTRDFYAWLKGCGNAEDHEKTPWGKQKVVDEECKEYLKSFVDAKFDYLQKLQSLVVKANVTNLVGLDEHLMYFKYIVRGGWETRSEAEFMFDYNEVMCCRKKALQEHEKYNTWESIMEQNKSMRGLRRMWEENSPGVEPTTRDNNRTKCGPPSKSRWQKDGRGGGPGDDEDDDPNPYWRRPAHIEAQRKEDREDNDAGGRSERKRDDQGSGSLTAFWDSLLSGKSGYQERYTAPPISHTNDADFGVTMDEFDILDSAYSDASSDKSSSESDESDAGPLTQPPSNNPSSGGGGPEKASPVPASDPLSDILSDGGSYVPPGQRKAIRSKVRPSEPIHIPPQHGVESDDHPRPPPPHQPHPEAHPVPVHIPHHPDEIIQPQQHVPQQPPVDTGRILAGEVAPGILSQQQQQHHERQQLRDQQRQTVNALLEHENQRHREEIERVEHEKHFLEQKLMEARQATMKAQLDAEMQASLQTMHAQSPPPPMETPAPKPISLMAEIAPDHPPRRPIAASHPSQDNYEQNLRDIESQTARDKAARKGEKATQAAAMAEARASSQGSYDKNKLVNKAEKKAEQDLEQFQEEMKREREAKISEREGTIKGIKALMKESNKNLKMNGMVKTQNDRDIELSAMEDMKTKMKQLYGYGDAMDPHEYTVYQELEEEINATRRANESRVKKQQQQHQKEPVQQIQQQPQQAPKSHVIHHASAAPASFQNMRRSSTQTPGPRKDITAGLGRSPAPTSTTTTSTTIPPPPVQQETHHVSIQTKAGPVQFEKKKESLKAALSNFFSKTSVTATDAPLKDINDVKRYSEVVSGLLAKNKTNHPAVIKTQEDAEKLARSIKFEMSPEDRKGFAKYIKEMVKSTNSPGSDEAHNIKEDFLAALMIPKSNTRRLSGKRPEKPAHPEGLGESPFKRRTRGGVK